MQKRRIAYDRKTDLAGRIRRSVRDRRVHQARRYAPAFWGVLKNEPSVPDHIIVTFDLRKKQYRRFDLRKPYALLNKKNVGCTLLPDTVVPNTSGVVRYD